MVGALVNIGMNNSDTNDPFTEEPPESTDLGSLREQFVAIARAKGIVGVHQGEKRSLITKKRRLHVSSRKAPGWEKTAHARRDTLVNRSDKFKDTWPGQLDLNQLEYSTQTLMCRNADGTVSEVLTGAYLYCMTF